MQARHDSYLDLLGDIGRGPGGRTVAVIGDPQASGYYWAGTRFEPVSTLFEAVLRFVLLASYDRVIAFTGRGSSHLPEWQLGGNLKIGYEELIWGVVGDVVPKPDAAEPKRLNRWERKSNEFRSDTTAVIHKLIWNSSGKNYWQRLERFCVQRDEEIKKASESNHRCALIMDSNFLIPNATEATQRTQGFDLALSDLRMLEAYARNSAACVLTNLEGTTTDLIIFSEDGLTHDLFQEKRPGQPSVLLQVLARYISPDEWENHHKLKLQTVMPHLCLSTHAEIIGVSKRLSPFSVPRVEVLAETGKKILYTQLRASRINRRPSVPAPPPRPDEIALEFWANLDTTPLKTALEDEIIGQAEAKAMFLNILERQKSHSEKVLEHGSNVRKTIKDERFRLPVIGLFGAAGMGKTTFCNVVTKSLFGDEIYGRVIDLSGKSLKVATIGVEPPMVGYDDESDLISFARQTGGLGVVCFDEFTRIASDRAQHNIASALAPLLQILQERKLEPANPKYRPPGRFYYFANTVFVFSANVSPPGEPAREGFVPIDDLGSPFQQRVTQIVYFKPLSNEDYQQAARRALARTAQGWGRDLRPDLAQAASAGVLVEDRLLEAFERRFKSLIDHSGEAASIRRLNQLAEGLHYDRAFDRLASTGGDRLVLGPELIPQDWDI